METLLVIKNSLFVFGKRGTLKVVAKTANMFMLPLARVIPICNQRFAKGNEVVVSI